MTEQRTSESPSSKHDVEYQHTNGRNVPNAKEFHWRTNAKVVGVSLLVGMLLLSVSAGAASQKVTKIKILRNESILPPFPSSNKWFLELWTDQEGIRTDVQHKRIGNGITFNMPRPVPLASINEIKVRTKNWIGGRIHDRVNVGRQHKIKGTNFSYKLSVKSGVISMFFNVISWGLILTGAVSGIYLLTRFLYWQAI